MLHILHSLLGYLRHSISTEKYLAIETQYLDDITGWEIAPTTIEYDRIWMRSVRILDQMGEIIDIVDLMSVHREHPDESRILRKNNTVIQRMDHVLWVYKK